MHEHKDDKAWNRNRLRQGQWFAIAAAACFVQARCEHGLTSSFESAEDPSNKNTKVIFKYQLNIL
jgi:hypothetical protein